MHNLNIKIERACLKNHSVHVYIILIFTSVKKLMKPECSWKTYT